MKTFHYIIAVACLALIMAGVAVPSFAQEVKPVRHLSAAEIGEEDDSLAIDSIKPQQALAKGNKPLMADSGKVLAVADTTKKQKRDWATWKPDPKRAMWLALVLPGAGQIYNRKYWKLPIFYGGFVGCAYAMRWNNMMYRDYSQAYLDIMDDDPNTQSYNQFLHLGTRITAENMSRWQEVFRKRKDRYRRWRDMSFFVMVGVYALSVIDAYVDASLSQFDISPDLSINVSPAVINSGAGGGVSTNPFKNTGLGMNCAITF